MGDVTRLFLRLEKLYADIAAGNVDAAMELYAQDAMVILQGAAPVSGTSAIKEWWRATVRDYRFDVRPELVETADFGGAVMLRGRAHGKMVPRSATGATVNVDLWFMQIYVRQQDGRLLFWRGASGANPPAGN